jgi:hypothetical protein
MARAICTTAEIRMRSVSLSAQWRQQPLVADRVAGEVDLEAHVATHRALLGEHVAVLPATQQPISRISPRRSATYERPWRDQVAVRIAHAQQQLVLRGRVRDERDDRLGDQLEAVVRDHVVDLSSPLHAALDLRTVMPFGAAARPAVTPGFLGVVHRGAAAALRRPSAPPVVLMRKQHRELVAAQACQHVAVAQARLQALGDAHDLLVARAVAQRVVEVLEVVRVEHQHRAARAITLHVRRVAVELALEAAAVQQAVSDRGRPCAAARS